jgi:hypothetical protein
MNLKKLKEVEEYFFRLYPEGFDDPEMQKIAKKHRLGKMSEKVHDYFREGAFDDPNGVVEHMAKVVGSASMISLFDKPKFKNACAVMRSEEKELLALGLKELLHGVQANGFEMMVEILADRKLAKWTLVTIIPVYYAPLKEVFVKPTTTKAVLKTFEIEDLVYKPRPSYDFYARYKEVIAEMKSHVDPSLAKASNAAFTGFLMMGIKGMEE